MLAAIPLTLIPLIIFNVVGFAFGGDPWGSQLFSITMMSGAAWILTLADAMIVVAIIILFLEILKAAQAGSEYGLQPHRVDRGSGGLHCRIHRRGRGRKLVVLHSHGDCAGRRRGRLYHFHPHRHARYRSWFKHGRSTVRNIDWSSKQSQADRFSRCLPACRVSSASRPIGV